VCLAVAEAMARLTIRLLGSFETALDREPVTSFETKKVQALLAYLAAEAGRPHPRELLAELLWPNRPTGAARANLRHALRDLRTALADRAAAAEGETGPRFLLVTRETIQLGPVTDVWVDTRAFLDLLAGPAPAVQRPVAQLEQAAQLYRGPFLEDLDLGDSAAFHEWVLLNRERFQHQASDVLHALAACYEAWGQHERALEHAWRLVGLAPWDEDAHLRAMRLLALTGQRGAALAHYEACRRVLAEELGVEPEAETTALYEAIRDGTFVSPAPAGKPALPVRLPGFLAEEVSVAAPPPFVAREGELARLDGWLDAALAGRAQVVFVTGGPGRGKTALLGEFARRAMEAHPDLLVASGNCNPISGAGDPYLPFRDVMAMLTGDVEARWAGGSITGDHARRLWEALPLAAAALASRGALLVGTLLGGEALLARATVALPAGTDWLGSLRALTERAGTGRVDLEQSHLFEQYAAVLRALAERHPLVLILDDLQWADSASIGLLFHLGRRLAEAGSRVLIACAYRPEEVALDAGNGERHPLVKALNELKRRFGDVWIDLGRVDRAEDRRFVDALLDSEPNRLAEGFRAALFRHTEGHPLFTVELLRAMQERGDLVRDPAMDGDGPGAWVEGPALNWEHLPGRVEAVIEERVGRLDPALAQILGAASVEGEVFTAQVVARVQGAEERGVLRRLAAELERRHRLVTEESEVQTGRARLSRYRFTHVLFQRFLYRRLSGGERRALHSDVAAALESLYQGQLGEIAVQLAHHFAEAGDDGRALEFLPLAAENAAHMYANDEAVAHFGQAIELAERVPLDAATLARLHRGRGLARETLGEFERARADLERALELARLLDDPAALAGSLNRVGNWYLNAESPGRAIAYHQEALEICEPIGDRRCLANTLDLLGITSILAGDCGASIGYFDRAVALFRELDDRPSLASSLIGRADLGGTAQFLLTVIPALGPADARRDFEEAMQIAREIGSPADEAWALWCQGIQGIVEGQFDAALAAAQRGLAIAAEIGHREWTVGNRFALGVLHGELFAHAEARQHLEEALVLAWELRSQYWVNHTVPALGRVCVTTDDPAQARERLDLVLTPQTPMDTLGKRYCWAWRAELALAQGDAPLALELADRLIASAPGMAPGRVITFLWWLRGQALAALGQVEEAHGVLRAAAENAQASGERFILWRIHASLARLYHALGRRPEAEGELSVARSLVAELAATIPDGRLKAGFLKGADGTLSRSRGPA
jgi:adenylate cyclase